MQALREETREDTRRREEGDKRGHEKTRGDQKTGSHTEGAVNFRGRRSSVFGSRPDSRLTERSDPPQVSVQKYGAQHPVKVRKA